MYWGGGESRRRGGARRGQPSLKKVCEGGGKEGQEGGSQARRRWAREEEGEAIEQEMAGTAGGPGRRGGAGGEKGQEGSMQSVRSCIQDLFLKGQGPGRRLKLTWLGSQAEAAREPGLIAHCHLHQFPLSRGTSKFLMESMRLLCTTIPAVDPKLAEFLALMAPRSKAKIWADDGMLPVQDGQDVGEGGPHRSLDGDKGRGSKGRGAGEGGAGAEDEAASGSDMDEEYQDLGDLDLGGGAGVGGRGADRLRGVAGESDEEDERGGMQEEAEGEEEGGGAGAAAATAEPGCAVVVDAGASDMDYLRSRIKKWADSDDGRCGASVRTCGAEGGRYASCTLAWARAKVWQQSLAGCKQGFCALWRCADCRAAQILLNASGSRGWGCEVIRLCSHVTMLFSTACYCSLFARVQLVCLSVAAFLYKYCQRGNEWLPCLTAP